jgi:CheY-like chemotaxis protein
MTRDPVDMMTPRILVVDDERQIHASLRLRIGREYDLVFCFSGQEALEKLSQDRFDLCLADIHMPHMDGLAFIDAARKADPELGYVVLSAFDTDENLRRAIPLQVYDFISKPLPERGGFEDQIPRWVAETRQRRKEHSLAARVDTIATDLDSARLEREVEIVASESARDALLQTANLLTTIHAHLVNASLLIAARAKTDAGAAHLLRNLEEARRTADAAVAVAEGFFDSAYGSRNTAPALVNEGMRDAIDIVTRTSQAITTNKVIDFSPLDLRPVIRGLSGIDLLLMMVPAIGIAVHLAPSGTTIGIKGVHCSRMDSVIKDDRLREYAWFNRRNLLASHPGLILTVSASSPPMPFAQVEGWFKGIYQPLATLTSRGLLAGVEKCRGLVGFSQPSHLDFRVSLVLPV